jgi:P4 family phage/plasmid primase-like protien
MKEIFLTHSARAAAYASDAHRRQNAKIWDDAKPSGRSGLGSLKHWAKKCNPDRYFAEAKSSYWALVEQDNANGYCEIFYNAMAGDILYSNSHKKFYVYDDRETLWKSCENNAHINFLFVEITSSVFRKMMADLPPARDEDEATKRKAKLKRLTEASKTCGGAFVITLVNSFLPALCRSEEDPANYFDQNPDLLPLTNGVWKFSEKKLVPYERDHFFTFRIPIAYNASADTSAIRRACLDWFGQDAEVAKFIQYWIGYCLTGHTTRQDFLIVWGTKAGNGKSLLWGTILSTLLDKYYRTITSDALSSERVGNNDQLYNLNGGRFAFLSEPRRAKGTQIDNEIVKTLTGDKYFTAEAKYKNAITFKLQAKFAMACNDMPDLKFEDKGTYRRVRICEQNCEFLDPDDYERADPAAKASRRAMLKDDAFAAALLENTEGLMLWALEGASAFVDNPRMEAPEAMGAAKRKAVDETDVLGQWLRSNIRNLGALPETERPAGWERKNLKFVTIKTTMRNQNVALGQNAAGFNKRMREKLIAMGYEIGGREEKGDLYIKRADETPEDDGLVVEAE